MKIRRILLGLLFLLGILGSLDTLLILLINNGGVNLGTILPGVVGGILIFLGIVNAFFRYIVPNVYLREYFAVVKSLIFDWQLCRIYVKENYKQIRSAKWNVK